MPSTASTNRKINSNLARFAAAQVKRVGPGHGSVYYDLTGEAEGDGIREVQNARQTDR